VDVERSEKNANGALVIGALYGLTVPRVAAVFKDLLTAASRQHTNKPGPLLLAAKAAEAGAWSGWSAARPGTTETRAAAAAWAEGTSVAAGGCRPHVQAGSRSDVTRCDAGGAAWLQPANTTCAPATARQR
jgi:hypothetical protein